MLQLEPVNVALQSLEAFQKDVEELVRYTAKLDIQSNRDAKKAIDYVARSRDLVDKIKEKKDELSESAKQYISSINKMSKKFMEPLDLVEDMIVQKLDHWKILKQQTQSEMAEFGLEIIPLFDDDSKNESNLATAYEKQSYVFDIEDVTEIPREYLKVDEEKIELALKNGIRNIPGLKVTRQTKTFIRRNKK